MPFRAIALALAASIVTATTALSEGRQMLGNGRLVNNDLFGDLNDRWHSGSVAASRVKGPAWTGALPQRPFEILEYRVGAQVMAPENLRAPAAGDRPFAGAVALGLHTHFERGGNEIALGGDLVFTGPQTGLGAFQTALHDSMGVSPASNSVLANQVKDGVHPTLVAEAGRTFALGSRGTIRPFTELRWGVETLARVGADITFGPAGQGELMVRDPVTGQRYRSVQQYVPGLSWVVGGDFTYVEDSAFLPQSSGVQATDTRTRVRTGVHWQGEQNAAFYGVTWMSEEFTAQPSGQMVGSMRLEFRF
ncbi:lipid A-modifier LpxR family protein [Thalassococcus lentus]|uniref:DUF2219 family protein n=1 Tax=Thalassococcus lentus TaxID=1210524 RepID=A0ABT4XNI4_9RHOB|nr:lipid A-modifier LpxR family protein [Thalassococcus lentus]MDA7423485.1 DUF2219 family protein [Thalassococcus lentus]